MAVKDYESEDGKFGAVLVTSKGTYGKPIGAVSFGPTLINQSVYIDGRDLEGVIKLLQQVKGDINKLE